MTTTTTTTMAAATAAATATTTAATALFQTQDLRDSGLTDQEVQAILSAENCRQQIRLMRLSRSRLLEEVHTAQQRLDRLDYFLFQLRKEEEKGAGTGAGAVAGEAPGRKTRSRKTAL